MGSATRESLRIGPQSLVKRRRQDALLALRDAVGCHRRVIDTFGLLIDQDPEVDGASPDGMGVDGDDMAIAESLRVVETEHARLLRTLCALEGKSAVAAMGLELSTQDTVAVEPGAGDPAAAGCATCGARMGEQHDGAAHDAMILRGKPFFRRMVIAEDGARFHINDSDNLSPVDADLPGGTNPKTLAERHGALRELFVPGSPEPFGHGDSGTVFVLSELSSNFGALAYKRQPVGNQLWMRDYPLGDAPMRVAGVPWSELNTVELVSVVRVAP